MKTINKTCGETIDEVVQAAAGLCRNGMRRLQRMSWPALLVSCVLLAMLLTILPLALTLFAIFLIVKVLAAATDSWSGKNGSSKTGSGTEY